MADMNWGPLQPEVDDIKGVYKKANDWFSKIPGGTPKSDHQKGVDEINKQLNDRRAADVAKSFQHPVDTAAQKKMTTPSGKTPVTKPAPRKKM